MNLYPFLFLGFLLVRFITDNLAESKRLMSTAASRNLQENTLVIRCINDLGLIQLERVIIFTCVKEWMMTPNRPLAHWAKKL